MGLGLGSYSFSTLFFPCPCTSSRVDHGDLEIDVGGCPPLTVEEWGRVYTTEGVAQSGVALGTELTSGV